ncbi:hypothetical protein M885DRAFT_617733 [Pelagophyceae sp. CCMP2097]|nr:hypothetical protein M885DRAFT_617733 [Pelagophyceae sp. CCMP2097]
MGTFLRVLASSNLAAAFLWSRALPRAGSARRAAAVAVAAPPVDGPLEAFMATRLGMAPEQIAKLLELHRPAPAAWDAEKDVAAWASDLAKWDANVCAVEKRLGLNPAQTRGVFSTLWKRDVLQTFDAPKLDSAVKQLESALGLTTKAQLAKVAVHWPHVVLADFAVDCEPKLVFLESKLDLSQRDLRKVVLARPQTLGNAIEAHEAKFAYLRTRLKLNKDQLRKLVVSYPAVLGLAIETNLEPTLQCYQEAMKLDSEKQLALFICSFPSALGRSVEGRLKPRLAQVAEAGILVDRQLLNRVMVSTDTQFANWLRTGPKDSRRDETTNTTSFSSRIFQSKQEARGHRVRMISKAIVTYSGKISENVPFPIVISNYVPPSSAAAGDGAAGGVAAESAQSPPADGGASAWRAAPLDLSALEATTAADSPNRAALDRLLDSLARAGKDGNNVG